MRIAIDRPLRPKLLAAVLRLMLMLLTKQSPFKYAHLKGKKGPPAHMPDIAEGREMQQGVGLGPGGMMDAAGVRSPSVSCSSLLTPCMSDMLTETSSCAL